MLMAFPTAQTGAKERHLIPGNASLGLEGQDGIRHLCRALGASSCHFNFEREVSQSSFTAEGLGRVFLSQ